MSITPQEIKKKIGIAAAELIKPGMIVGLGTGSTARCFIEALIQRCESGLSIQAVATSQASEELALQGNIPLLDSHKVTHVDITVDGADAIDHQKRMIKGAGGALLREKILAAMSREMVVLVDESKLVHNFLHKTLPIEIVPFGKKATENHLSNLGLLGSWRKDSQGDLQVTDNGNYLYDVVLKTEENPEILHEKIKKIPGVVETGFFFHIAGRVIVGFPDGQVIIKD